MRLRIPLSALAILITVGVFAGKAKDESDPKQAPFASLAGNQLIQQLRDEKSRGRAFYELWRRAKSAKDAGFAAFQESHYDAEIVVCPQGPTRPPLYIVLCGFLPKTDVFGRSGYAVEKPDELFLRSP